MTRQAAVLRVLVRVTAAAVLVQPAVSRAQKVRLEVRPHVGDTLIVQLEHAVTISSAPRAGYAAVAPSTNTYRLQTREIVERPTARGSSVTAVIDSVSVSATGPQNAGMFPGLDRSLEGKRFRLTLSPDGTSTVAEGEAQLDEDLRAFIGATPSLLPATAVAAGESWTKALPMPMEGSTSTPVMLRTTLHLDSLTDGGNTAWISLRGSLPSTLKPDSAPRPVESKGTLTGSFVLDRKRGWLVDSRVVVNIESVVAMPGAGEPLVVNVRVTQTMRTARR